MEGKRPRGRRRMGMLKELYENESYGIIYKPFIHQRVTVQTIINKY